MNAAVEQVGSDTTAMRPFRVDVPEADLTELRRRIKATWFAEKEPVADMSPGAPLATVEKLARYWANDHQLIRQQRSGQDRTFAIEFLDPAAQVFVFTFG